MTCMSRAVVHDEEDPQGTKVDHEGAPSSLTVWRKSLLLNCKGFTVIDSNGDLVYRVDDYAGRRPEELVLMDGSGKPLLSMIRRKIKLGLRDSWLVYEGEVGDDCNGPSSSRKQQPIWCVKKQVNLTFQSTHTANVLAHVFRGNLDKRCAYMIEGSYRHKSCKILDNSSRVVAEIRRKESVNGGISFGADVFVLTVQPGFNTGFAMALVMVLDQMFS